MLDLGPTLEHEIVERAEANGMTANQYVGRLLAADKVRLKAASVETPEQTRERVFGLLAKWQAKNPFPEPPGGFKTLAELRAEWAIEDANMTEEERAAEDTFWEEHIQAMLNSPGVSI